MISHCATCGTALPPGAQFCPRCGANLNVAPAPAVPPPSTQPPPPAARPHRTAIWLVPLVLIVVGGGALLLLMGMPFGGDDTERPAIPAADTIAEGGPAPSRGPATTDTIVDVEEQPPAAVARPRTEPNSQPRPEAVTEPRPQPRTQTRTPPPPPAPRAAAEISESEAESVLRGYLTSRDYYETGADCVSLSTVEYRNAGYTIDVTDSCNSRRLGRWRVDSKTRELFRQREDGRYLRP